MRISGVFPWDWLSQSMKHLASIQKVFVRQEYHNLAGFMLPGGNPSNPVFPASQDERNVYKALRFYCFKTNG